MTPEDKRRLGYLIFQEGFPHRCQGVYEVRWCEEKYFAKRQHYK